MEEFFKVRILQETVEQRPIIAIHGGAEEAAKTGKVEHDGSPAEGPRGFLDHGLIEGLVTLYNPDCAHCLVVVHLPWGQHETNS